METVKNIIMETAIIGVIGYIVICLVAYYRKSKNEKPN